MAEITLELSTELEERLRTEAAKQGIEPQRFIVEVIQSRLQNKPIIAKALSQEETILLQQINLGVSSEVWDEYNILIEKRRAETLTLEEQSRLIEISDRIEALNAQRMQALVQLAELRNEPLPTVMDTLGIQPASNV